MSSNNNADEFAGQVNRFGESGRWHDAAELSRKDGARADNITPTQETVIAERTLDPSYPISTDRKDLTDKAADMADQAKEAAQDAADTAKDQAAGFAAMAQQKAGELWHAAADPVIHAASAAKDAVVTPVINAASAAKEAVVHAKDAVVSTTIAAKDAVIHAPIAAKEAVVNTAGAVSEKAADAFHAAQHKAAELTGLAAPGGLHDAIQNMKPDNSEHQEGGEQRGEMPKSALSGISEAELLMQKANIKFNADAAKITDSSLPLTERAAAAADAVAQKATALYEAGVIKAQSAFAGKAEQAQQQQQAPTQAAQ
jgi:hypothetical protein